MNLCGKCETETISPLCPPCITEYQQYLDQLPVYLGVLGKFKAKSLVPQSAGTRVSSSSVPSTPLNVHVLDVIDEVREVLSWIDGRRIEELVYVPDGMHVTFLVERVWRKADQVVGFGDRWEQRLMPCPRCRTRTLGSWAGVDKVECSSCGGVMTRQEYNRVSIIQAGKD